MLKDKKVLAGAAVLLIAVFWFYVKPHYMDKAPAPPPTAEQIAAAYKPTILLGQPTDVKAAATWQGLKMNLKNGADGAHYALAVIALEFADPKGTYVGVKTTAALDAKNAKFADDLGPEMNQILAAATTVMGEKSMDDIATADGKDALAQDLASAINAELKDQQVEKVYFPTLITQ